MKKSFTFFAVIAAAFMAFSCNDMDELEDRMDNLESRVQALETICTALNNNVLALQEFTEANKSISKVEESEGKYILTLSDGSKIEISQGSEGTAVMPDIAIDSEGYWTVNGERVLSGGQPVPATGEDGATPIFGVDKDGYWTVKYSADDTPTQVLDENGKPVKAIPDGQTPGGSGDQFFDDVQVLDDCVEVTIDGQKYSLPIIPDFMCSIKTDGSEPVMFNLSETKTFTVEQKNVAAATIFAPQGWEAALEENTLTVIAPASVTKATADTRQDVSILAISRTGFAAISKIRVQLNDAPIIITPTAAVTAGEATDKTLSFTVALSNATTWYYMLKKSAEAAPTAEEMKAAAEGSEKELTLSEDSAGAPLEPETEYTLYVLPVNGETEGEIAKASKTTAEKQYATLYEKYMDGKDIVIGARTYNKATYGDAKVISAESPSIATSYNGTSELTKIFFVDQDAAATYDYTGAVKYMVIIGNTPGTRSRITVNQQIKLNQGTDQGEFVMSGIDFDSTPVENHPLVQNADGAFEYCMFNDCHIRTLTGKALTYISSDTRSFRNLTITGSEYEMASASNYIISVGSSTAKYGTIEISNSIIYNTTEDAIDGFRVFNGNKASIEKVVLNGNTFINLHSSTPGGSSLGAIYVDSIVEMECSKNIIFTNKAMGQHSMLLRATDGKYPADGSKITDNIVYKGEQNSAYNWQICYGGSKTIPGSEDVRILNEDPFSGGTFDVSGCKFIPGSAYASYGAQR